MAVDNPYRVKLLEYLTSFGLDGREISEDYTDTQYRVLNPYGPEDWRDWPEGLDTGQLRMWLTMAHAHDYENSARRARSD